MAVICAWGSSTALAAKATTATIPIVFAVFNTPEAWPSTVTSAMACRQRISGWVGDRNPATWAKFSGEHDRMASRCCLVFLAVKANKKPRRNPGKKARSTSGATIAKMFNFAHSKARPHAPPFSKTNQPKRNPGRPPGVQNLFTREIKTAAVNAATLYGADSTGLGGLEGFFYRCCHLYGQTMVALLGRIMPVQKDADSDKKRVFNTPEEFDEALKARGLPSLTHMLALEFQAGIKTIDGKATETK